MGRIAYAGILPCIEHTGVRSMLGWRPQINESAGATLDGKAFRQQALIANLWVILATIGTSAALSLPFAGAEAFELSIGFGIYFLTNSLAHLALISGRL